MSDRRRSWVRAWQPPRTTWHARDADDDRPLIGIRRLRFPGGARRAAAVVAGTVRLAGRSLRVWLPAGDTVQLAHRLTETQPGDVTGGLDDGTALAVGNERVSSSTGIGVPTALSIPLAADARVLLRRACVVPPRSSRSPGPLGTCSTHGSPAGADSLARGHRFRSGPRRHHVAAACPAAARLLPGDGVGGDALRTYTMERLESAVDRALSGSPTHRPSSPTRGICGQHRLLRVRPGGASAGTDGRVAGVAELGATRLHRMMNPTVTGLTAQVTADPGPHTGLSTVHKRAIGATHGLRHHALPATVRPVDASAGRRTSRRSRWRPPRASGWVQWYRLRRLGLGTK